MIGWPFGFLVDRLFGRVVDFLVVGRCDCWFVGLMVVRFFGVCVD